MFILRQIFKDGTPSNRCIGDNYTVIHREGNKEKFNESLGLVKSHPDQEKIYAFLEYGNGVELWPLYEYFSYYIMTESGKTFDNISFG